MGSSGEREPCISCNLRAPSEIFGPNSLFIEVICTDHLPASTVLEPGRPHSTLSALDIWPLIPGAGEALGIPGVGAVPCTLWLLPRWHLQGPLASWGMNSRVCQGGSVNQRPGPFHVGPLDRVQTELFLELLKDEAGQERLQILGIYSRAACFQLSILVSFRSASRL